MSRPLCDSIAAFALVFAALYLMFGFACWELWPGYWSSGERAGLSIMQFMCGLPASIITYCIRSAK